MGNFVVRVPDLVVRDNASKAELEAMQREANEAVLTVLGRHLHLFDLDRRPARS